MVAVVTSAYMVEIPGLRHEGRIDQTIQRNDEDRMVHSVADRDELFNNTVGREAHSVGKRNTVQVRPCGTMARPLNFSRIQDRPNWSITGIPVDAKVTKGRRDRRQPARARRCRHYRPATASPKRQHEWKPAVLACWSQDNRNERFRGRRPSPVL